MRQACKCRTVEMSSCFLKKKSPNYFRRGADVPYPTLPYPPSTTTVQTGGGEGRGFQFSALYIRRTLCRHVTIGTPMVILCCLTALTVFDSQNSKNDHWCTNRHMSTQSPPNTQSPYFLQTALWDCQSSEASHGHAHFWTLGCVVIAA